jgi:hypothetical protein
MRSVGLEEPESVVSIANVPDSDADQIGGGKRLAGND